jgi:transcriptional antiterminator RfaH
MTQPGRNAGGLLSWIVINTHPQKERFAIESLEQLQFSGYCPMHFKRIRHARRSALVARPMFPACVFAGLRAAGRWWRPILTAPGVCTIMRSGEPLHFLPEGFVEALRACEVDGKIAAPVASADGGHRPAGPGAGYGALIADMLEMSERDRLLALFGLSGPGAVATTAAGLALARHCK